MLKRLYPFWLSLIILVFLNSSLSIATEKESLNGFNDILSFELQNGLKIVIWPDLGTEQVSMRKVYRVGSLQEKTGLTGIAHLFEHMMLRPSKYAPAGGLSFERTLGAKIGATTRFKTTDYYVTLGSEKLEEMIRYYADIMQNLPLDANMLKNEKEAVRSEYLIWDNSPFMALLPELTKSIYPGHLAENFITGQRKDLDAITAEDCLKFYKSYYAPNNAIIILTGNIDVKKTVPWIEKYFGSIPRGVEAQLPDDIQMNPKSRIAYKKILGTSNPIFIGYPIPFKGLQFPEDSALGLALSIVFSGPSSLVGNELINKSRMAADVSYHWSDLGFYFASIDLTGRNAQKAIENSDKAVLSLQNLSPAAYQRFAVAYQADLLRELQTPTQRADLLEQYMTHRNGIASLQIDLEAAKKISLEQVKAAAKKYLQVEHRIAVVGQPTDGVKK
jgi:zinc protease